MEYFLVFSSAILAIFAYVLYFRQVKNHSISPNRWSWLVWSFAIFLETLTYNEISQDYFKSIVFFISSICCIVITILIWNRAQWKKPEWTEIVSVVLSLAALVLWVIFNYALWAHFVLLFALPIAFIPTYLDALKDYRQEDSKAWLLWSISDLLIIIIVLLRLEKGQEIPYAIIEFICHFIVVIIIQVRKNNLYIKNEAR